MLYFIYIILLVINFLVSFLILSHDLKIKKASIISGSAFGVLYLILIPFLIFSILGNLTVNDPDAPSSYSAIHFYGEDLFFSVIILVNALIFLTLSYFWQINCNEPWYYFSAYLHSGKKENIKENNKTEYLILLLFLLICYAILHHYSGQEVEHWYKGKEEFFENYGTLSLIVVHGIFISRILLLCALMQAYFKNKIGTISVCISLLSIFIVDLYITGNRIFVLQSSALFFFVMLSLKRYKTMLFLFLASLPVATALALFAYFRAFMHSDGLAAAYQFSHSLIDGWNSIIITTFSAAFETVNINVLVKLHELLSKQGLDITQLSYLKIFLLPIPRSVLPTKPDTITIVVANMLDNRDMLSLVATAFGEAFVNVRYFAPFVLLPLLLLLECVAKQIQNKQLKDFFCFVIGFSFIRFPYSDLLISTILGVSILIVIRKSVSLFRRQ